MDLLLPYMERERKPMAEYIYQRLVIPLVDGDELNPELPGCFYSLMVRAQTDSEFQRVVFGAPDPFVKAGVGLDSPAAFAVVRAFGVDGDWVPRMVADTWSRRLEEITFTKDQVIRLFYKGAVGAPDTIWKQVELSLDAKEWWPRLCGMDEKAFFLRGSLRKRYSDCKAIFWGMCYLVQTYLESNSYLTVLSILCLCSTFNLYSKVYWLRDEFKRLSKYVAQLNVPIDNASLTDARSVDQAVLQIIRDKKGARYQSLFKKLQLSSIFPETVELLLSESLL